MTYSRLLPNGVDFNPDSLQRNDQQLRNDYVGGNETTWYEDGEREDELAPTSLCSPTRATLPVLQDDKAYWAAVPLSDEGCATATRQQLAQQVVDEIPSVATAEVLTLDPQAFNDADYMRYSAAATAKLDELEDVPDGDLGEFDPTLEPSAPDDDTVSRSQLTMEIADLEPWGGAPQNDIGWMVVLRTAVGREADGAELRVKVIAAPAGKDRVIPATQSNTDPRVWVAIADAGYLWSDRNLSATIRCYWGSGSLFITPNITAAAYGHEYRKPAPIEYGLP